jgi:hypothetical protein
MLVNNEFKGYGRKKSWHCLRHYTRTCRGLAKISKISAKVGGLQSLTGTEHHSVLRFSMKTLTALSYSKYVFVNVTKVYGAMEV